MRLPIPQKLRQHVVERLSDAYDEPTCSAIREALAVVCRHYGVSVPRVRWLSNGQRRRYYGLTHDSGVIFIQRPAYWRRQKKMNTEADWLNVILHELGHHIYWAQKERKADQFARAFLEGTL